MDEKDIRILRTIATIGTDSPAKLSEQTTIPKSTVQYRIENLRDEGIITNELFDIPLEKVSLDLTVITEVGASYDEGYHDEVGRKLGQVEGVNQVYFTMGDTDFVVISHLADRDMVEHLIGEFEAIEEVERTSSKFAIKTVKDEDRPVNEYEKGTLVGSPNGSPVQE
jgi:DNA-binding Lrp family transcriptional regulator